jgi:hypothetical protein
MNAYLVAKKRKDLSSHKMWGHLLTDHNAQNLGNLLPVGLLSAIFRPNGTRFTMLSTDPVEYKPVHRHPSSG